MVSNLFIAVHLSVCCYCL